MVRISYFTPLMNRRRFLLSTLALPLLGRAVAQAASDCVVHGAPPDRKWSWPTEEAACQRMFLIGDWGTRGALQHKVAAAMNTTAESRGSISAIISVGDNIYPSGVESADDPLWASSFEKVYTGPQLNVPWIAVLGNHDYRKRVLAQVEYGQRNKKWIMPSTYFSHVVADPSGVRTRLICLDTQQLLQRNDGWKDQLAWLDRELQNDHDAHWNLVIGHHPMRSYGHYKDNAWMLNELRPRFAKGGIDAYVCGHDHDLQIIDHPDDPFLCVVTGGGGGCRPTNWGEHTVAAATNGGFARWSATRERASFTLVNSNAELVGVAVRNVKQR